MRFLFVHQNFPGQYLHLVRHLAAARKHEIVFITQPNANEIPGVRKLTYRRPDPPPADTHWSVQEFEMASRRAEAVAQTAVSLRNLGFQPDIIIGHHGWGELLNIRDVWPETPLLGYFEFFYHTDGIDVGFDPEFPANRADFPRIRAKNTVNLLALNLDGWGQTPTAWQLSTYPEWAYEQISLLPEGVNVDFCKPDPAARNQTLRIGDAEIAPGEKLVTYVARDLEPYRGFHIVMRALPHLLAARKDVRVVLVGGDGVSYGAAPRGTTWKQVFQRELAGRFDEGRVLFPGRIDYRTYMRMLQRSDAHVYLTYPFVASWSLREALAAGCPIVGSDTEPVREFIRHDRTGLLTPFFDAKALTRSILSLLEDEKLAGRLRTGARRYAEKHLAMGDYITAYAELIGKLMQQRGRRPVGRPG